MTTPVVALIAVTDSRNGVTHLVAEEAISAGRTLGRYVAVCGAEVLSASLTAPDNERCRFCRVWWAEHCR